MQLRSSLAVHDSRSEAFRAEAADAAARIPWQVTLNDGKTSDDRSSKRGTVLSQLSTVMFNAGKAGAGGTETVTVVNSGGQFTISKKRQ